MSEFPKAITIAGSDSGGGAGIQADLKTFCMFNVYGASAITALTAQNTQGVEAIHVPPVEFFKQQLVAVLSDINFDSGKLGMLANAEIINALAEVLETYPIAKLVVDPVMISKHGAPLLVEEASTALIDKVLPLAYILTPNLHEAAHLTGMLVRDRGEMLEAAKRIHEMGPSYVLIKGGHLSKEEQAIDLLYDGENSMEFTRQRLDAKHTHGTGCTLSAAIAANLARGKSVEASVAIAKDYLHSAIHHAYSVGKGISPVDHLFLLQSKN